ncbi:MAG: response regulator, partial [Candidatus Riflebacteria bacterium]|nr:response regulator [Candidatus Riflebacteria bacterium]
KMLSTMKLSALHLLSLICDVLDVAKIDSGQMELRLEPLNLRKLLEECSSIIGARIKSGVNFIVEVPMFDFGVISDASRLKQVFLNVLGNAVKFTQKGSVKISLSQMTYLEEEQVKLCFCIEDTGIGISEEEIQTLFQPFRQLRSDQFEGTGMGLYISAAVLKLLNGSIEIKSQSGIGTQVFISLVMKKCSLPSSIEKSRPVEKHWIQKLKNLRVLIVEDLDVNIVVIQALLLTFLGITSTASAKNGQLGVEKLAAENFDVVLMDIEMPVMDGITATKAIRKAGHTVPIIAMSANAFLEKMESARQAGVTDYLTKPIQKEQLIPLFQKLFASSDQESEIESPAPSIEQDVTVPTSLNKMIFEHYFKIFSDKTIAQRVTKASIESIIQCTEELREAVLSEKAKEQSDALHKLKGALLNGNMMDLAGLTDGLQKSVKNGDLVSTSPGINSLIKTLEEITSADLASSLETFN